MKFTIILTLIDRPKTSAENVLDSKRFYTENSDPLNSEILENIRDVISLTKELNLKLKNSDIQIIGQIFKDSVLDYEKTILLGEILKSN